MIASTGGIEDNTWWSALEGATLDDGGWTYGICPTRGDGGSSQKPPASSDRGSIAFAKTMAISNGVRSRSHRQMTEPWYSLKPWRSAMELKYYSYYRWWLFHVDTNRNIVSPCMIMFLLLFRALGSYRRHPFFPLKDTAGNILHYVDCAHHLCSCSFVCLGFIKIARRFCLPQRLLALRLSARKLFLVLVGSE